ncbi:MAG: zinc ABC transporter substrate-binding protein [Armatimonadetes bacterium]|nr:zinc ABC transporter substrate-binding protein [Armatimonadota bacterium]
MMGCVRVQGALILVAVSLLVGTSGCAGPRDRESRDAGKLVVVASIPPLADFASKVGGERVQVETLVQSGMSPHTFEPTPAQLAAVSRASVLVLNGIGLEPWADDLVGAAANPTLRVARTAEGLDIIDERSHIHGETTGNPHCWLDPQCAVHQVEHLRDALVAADPDAAGVYRDNAKRFIAELHELDAEITAEVAQFETTRFAAQHAVWTYFAKHYGLVEAAVVETTPGREPSPGEIAEIIRTVRETEVRAIFADAQLSRRAAEAIATESGAKVVVLDPLGSDYVTMMRENVRRMGEALGVKHGGNDA